jgi:CRP-like cAMP-binding protein
VNNPLDNRLLSQLSSEEYRRVSDFLEPVELSLNEIIIKANQQCKSVYFPTQGIVSLMLFMNDGSTTEIGLIGTEGMVGTFQFLGKDVCHTSALVQMKGAAMRLDVKKLQTEFDRGEKLQKLILYYAWQLHNQISLCAGCNNTHTVKQRTARWLLMVDDRTESKTFFMTQQLMSKMLGVRRSGVTEVAAQMQRQGIISYQRGHVKIVDRPALEAVACECYQKLKNI